MNYAIIFLLSTYFRFMICCVLILSDNYAEYIVYLSNKMSFCCVVVQYLYTFCVQMCVEYYGIIF